MTSVNQNVRIYRGDTHVMHVALTNADGSPYDSSIPGIQMRYRITRAPFDDSKSVVQKSLGDGITIVTGGVDIELEAGDTDQPVGLYYHELKIQDGVDVATVMTGFAIIKRAARMGDEPQVPQGDLTISADAPTRTP